MNLIKKNITFQLFVIITVLILPMVIIDTYISIKRNLTLSENYLTKRGALTTEILVNSIKLPLFSENLTMASSQIDAAMEDESILGVKVFNNKKRETICKIRDKVDAREAIEIRNDEAKTIPEEEKYLIEGKGQKLVFYKVIKLSNNPIFNSQEYIGYQITDKEYNILGQLAVYISTKQRQIDRNEILRSNLSYGFIFWVLSLILSYIISQKFTLPIKQLIAAVKKVEQNGFGHVIDGGIKIQNEIGLLTDAFNHMSITICNRQKEKEFLEKAVWLDGQKDALNEIKKSIGEDLINLVRTMLHYTERIEKDIGKNGLILQDFADLKELQKNTFKILLDLNSHREKEAIPKSEKETVEIEQTFDQFENNFNKRLPNRVNLSLSKPKNSEKWTILINKAQLWEVLKKICIFVALKSRECDKGKAFLSMQIKIETMNKNNTLNLPYGLYCTAKVFNLKDKLTDKRNPHHEHVYEAYFNDMMESGVDSSLAEIANQTKLLNGVITIINIGNTECCLKIYLPLIAP